MLRVATVAILARLLAPEDFGVFAAVAALLEVLRPFASLGMDWALVHRGGTNRSEQASVWVSTLILSGAATLLVVLVAPSLASLIEIPAMKVALWVVSPAILLNSLSQIATAFLKRSLAFRRLALVEFAATNLGGGLVPIFLAWLGWGHWALLLGLLAEGTVRFALATALGAHREIQLRGATWDAWKPLARFGVGQTLALGLNAVALNGDYWVVGKLLGADALGLYNRSYQLVSTPPGIIGAIAGKVLFPVIARTPQAAPDRSRLTLLALAVASLAAVPTAGFCLVHSSDVVLALLGAGWGAAITPFRILSLAIFARSELAVMGAVVSATGRVYRFSLVQGLYAGAIVGGSIVGAQWGLLGVCVSTIASMVGLACALAYLLRSELVGGVLALLGSLFRGLPLAIVGVIPSVLMASALDGRVSSAIARVAVNGCVAVLCGAAFVGLAPRLALGRSLHQQLRSLVRSSR